MTIIAVTRDGKKIASTSITAAGRVGAGVLTFNTRVADLNHVDYLLQVNLDVTHPSGYANTLSEYGRKISDNIVGITVYAGAGVSVSGEIITQGR